MLAEVLPGIPTKVFDIYLSRDSIRSSPGIYLTGFQSSSGALKYSQGRILESFIQIFGKCR